MNILFLTQYYPPEVGAPQNRLSELAVRFHLAGHRVEVLTAMPNYPLMRVYPKYRRKWYVREEMQGVTVHRSTIFVRQSASVSTRLLTYFSFVFTSFWTGWTRLPRFDIIICESPPLFLGISGWLLTKLKGARLLLNVSDLWPESAEKLGLVTNRLFLSLTGSLERFLYRHSDLISGQTQGIVGSISSRVPDKPVFWLKNGVDLMLYSPGRGRPGWREEQGYSAGDFILFYGGIVGHAQGLEVVLQAAVKLRDDPHLKFVLAGEGPVKTDLIRLAGEWGLTNVRFLPLYPKERMADVIREIDAAVVPLKKLELFRGAIPSKMFEHLAMGKPVLLGVEGEAYDLFVEQGRCALPFAPGDAGDLVRAICKLQNDPALRKQLSGNAYIYVSEYFNREKIFSEFQQFITKHLDLSEPAR